MHQPKLEHDHTSEAVKERLARPGQHSYLGDFVLGAIDGAVTTFAVVSAAAGAGVSAGIAIIMGVANLLADGFSMAASAYLSLTSEQEEKEKVRRMEEEHIAQTPEGEREELRQIFAAKGFEGTLLEQVVDVLSRDQKRWVDTMMTEEHGLQEERASPLRAAGVTYLAFILAGAVPLLSFLPPLGLSPEARFAASAALTGLTFALIGAVKGRIVGRPVWRSSLLTLLLGGAAAAMAYGVGTLLEAVGGG